MNRLLLTGATRAARPAFAQRQTAFAARSFVTYRPQFNKEQKSQSKQEKSEGQQQSSGSSNRGKLAVLLGVLAIGSSILSISYNKNAPAEFIEPPKKTFKDNEVSVIFILGGPGSGKGTQCAKLVKDYNFAHLSAGDLLRAEQAREGSEFGELIDKCIREGTIVPQEVTIALLRNAMLESQKNGVTRFLIDGFPRKMDQALTFENEVATSAFTIFFECPEEVMLKRLLERGKTSGRTDDNIESIKKRFRTFIETSFPVVEYFDKQGKVVKLQCNKSVDEVYGEVQKALKDKINI
ncbi:CYFA0S12e00804g1_1 [Cyberlindnera fabianii]|uniref:Uridylate kinase n=1 Tax=Cyberlindnera fabianii TaxID=36022 RepID=A0A061B0N6_CYBFA|nr:Uridylate kinase [Cyberlindnera fabianii]CDR43468.1 CYFA0S12e00804g1_1 [Cyberlindnera fabianii]